MDISENTVLIIEDDEMLNAGLCYNLQKAGINAEPVYTLAAAKEAIKNQSFDLLLLDVNLPDGNGFHFAEQELCRNKIPFIFLTAHSLDDEVVGGFRLGADDYITKPFNIRIVVERIQAVLRRCGKQEEIMIYSCGNLQIDFHNRIVKKRPEQISLTPTEFSLLEMFCKHRNQILTKEMLLEHIWDNKGNYVNEHTLTINISRLRNKIEDEEHTYIKTIYGMGYKWIGDGNE